MRTEMRRFSTFSMSGGVNEIRKFIDFMLCGYLMTLAKLLILMVQLISGHLIKFDFGPFIAVHISRKHSSTPSSPHGATAGLQLLRNKLKSGSNAERAWRLQVSV